MLSPSGLGADAYRNVEILVAGGTVPFMERGMGLERGWHRLPVAWVNDYAELTWSYIRQAWAEILYNRPHYDFTRLTQRFWHHDIIERLCATGDGAFMDDEFPDTLPQFRHTRLYPAQDWIVCWPELHPQAQRNDTIVRRCTKGGKSTTDMYKEWKIVP
jgi:hypothetical protein